MGYLKVELFNSQDIWSNDNWIIALFLIPVIALDDNKNLFSNYTWILYCSYVSVEALKLKSMELYFARTPQ
jgi:hypothetical protein